MRILGELFNDPVNFFKKRRSFRTGFALMLASLFIFVLLNQAMIHFGLVQFKLKADPVTALVMNYITLVGGYFVVTAICAIPFRLIGGRSIRDLYSVVAYSLIPMVFLWIPHVIPQAIIIVLNIILITKGVAIRAKTRNRKALAVTATFVILVIVLSLIVGNFILPYSWF
jgi:hypothetical protein